MKLQQEVCDTIIQVPHTNEFPPPQKKINPYQLSQALPQAFIYYKLHPIFFLYIS